MAFEKQFKDFLIKKCFYSIAVFFDDKTVWLSDTSKVRT